MEGFELENKLTELQLMDVTNVRQAVWAGLNKLRSEGSSRDGIVRASFSLAVLAYFYKPGFETDDLKKSISKVIKNNDIKEQLTQIFKEQKEEVTEISKACSKQEIKAYIAQFSGDYIGWHTLPTPMSICDLAIKILDITDKDVVLDLCSGINSFGIEVEKSNKPKKIVGVEINTESMFIALVKNAVLGLNIENIQGNAISQDYSNLNATKVFSNFPFGFARRPIVTEMRENGRLGKYFINTKRTASSDWVFSLAAFLNQAKDGKTLTVMANSGLINNPDEGIRQYLVESGLVEAVISLPPRLLTGTNIPINILVMSNGNEKVKLVDATEIFTEGRRYNTLSSENISEIVKAYSGKTKNSVLISKEDLAKQGYVLSPSRYILREETEIKNAVLLGDLCLSISRGAVLRAEDLDAKISKVPTKYQYLLLKNINNGTIDAELPYLEGIEEGQEHYIISNGDIIMSKISPFKVAMAHVPKGQQIMANGNLYLIKVDKKKINPTFFMLYLQSETGMSELNRLAKGAVMKALSIRDLKDVRIANVPIETQNKIVEEYEDLRSELLIIEKQKANIEYKMSDLLQEVL